MNPELYNLYLILLTKKDNVSLDDDGSVSVSDGNWVWGIDEQGWFSYDLWGS